MSDQKTVKTGGPKPPSAYNIFFRERRHQLLQTEPTLTFGELSVRIAAEWKERSRKPGPSRLRETGADSADWSFLERPLSPSRRIKIRITPPVSTDRDQPSDWCATTVSFEGDVMGNEALLRVLEQRRRALWMTPRDLLAPYVNAPKAKSASSSSSRAPAGRGASARRHATNDVADASHLRIHTAGAGANRPALFDRTTDAVAADGGDMSPRGSSVDSSDISIRTTLDSTTDSNDGSDDDDASSCTDVSSVSDAADHLSVVLSSSSLSDDEDASSSVGKIEADMGFAFDDTVADTTAHLDDDSVADDDRSW